MIFPTFEVPNFVSLYLLGGGCNNIYCSNVECLFKVYSRVHYLVCPGTLEGPLLTHILYPRLGAKVNNNKRRVIVYTNGGGESWVTSLLDPLYFRHILGGVDF